MDYGRYLRDMYNVAVKHGNIAEAANIADEYQQMYGKDIDMTAVVKPKRKGIKLRLLSNKQQ